MEHPMSDITRHLARSARALRRRAVSATAVGAGAVAAAVPALARAAEEQGRALESPASFEKVAFFTLLGSGAVLLLASLGRMYQRQRGIRWRFQDPDAPHDAHH
jgi:hypothetical protein